MKRRGPKRYVDWAGCSYAVRSDKIDIPDLQTMKRIDALLWLNANTYPRGCFKPNPLAGYGDAIQINT